jgi:NAD(P)-dependent dehydrogenase (short-subunit alcohol dehydrogenase family)
MTFEPLENLNGKIVVITGVMGGIGFAIAKRLAAKGAKIIGIVRHDVESAQNSLNQLPNAHLNHVIVCADLLHKDQLQNAYNQIEKFGRIDVLVNTVGKTYRYPIVDLDAVSDEFFDKMLQDNLRTYYSAIRTFLPLLKATPESVVVNISSTAGSRSYGSNVAYCAAKAGIDSLTRTLSSALAPIRVMSVSPGAVETNFVPNQPENFYNSITNYTPLRRIVTVEDVAAAVEACVTLLRFCTGQVIIVDGGKFV